MCGVIGIHNAEDIGQDLYNALLLLQHRGQDACGILTVDDESLYLNKYQGLVSDVFSEKTLKQFKGRTGIGHVRYPTVGSSSLQDAQPFYLNYPTGIGAAHNGNVINCEELRSQLRDNQRALTSKCDVEIILNVLAEELLKLSSTNSFENIKEAVKNVFIRVNGGYSVITVSVKNRLVAFRDPKGIRPLVIGKKQTKNGVSHAFCSETAPLEFLGYEIVRDVKPGEVIYVNPEGVMKSETLTDEKPAHCMFEWVYFARPDAIIEGVTAYEARRNLGKELAREIRKRGIEFDVVMPVPDSSRPTAISCAEALEKPCREGLVKNRYSFRTFIMPTQELRENAVRLKLSPIANEIKGKKILLVDDSIVRGTTSKKIVAMVKKAGAKEVHLAVACPAILHPCFYGVDMSTTDELIAANKKLEETEKFIGADSVTYQTIAGLKNAIPLHLCVACLNGDYPTDVSKYAEDYGNQRKQERLTAV
ncbi:amidophosphoribosyltransferase [Candidatus Micrarchaeota archaeon]|nr:amidophosphoribosyltransferase [Candidatus Micrarchaeota archaeon]